VTDGDFSGDARRTRLEGLGARIPPQAWHALLVHGAPRRYLSGEILVRQGDPGGYVLALNRGLVKVGRVEADGHELVLAVRGPGEIIGESTYVGEQARSATVTAISTCDTYTVSHVRFRSIVTEFKLNEVVLGHVTGRLHESEDIRSELTGLPPRRRIARMLLRFSPGGTFALPQGDLAKAVGLSRSAVAIELAWLRAQELVITGRGRVMIADRSRLASLAAGLPDHP
jgi:CRP/FNR family transcriptional regulator, cyclic AMP receptor protein